MKLLLDMNLSPALVPALKAEGWDVVHWTDIGDITAPDKDIMRSAQADGRVVVTNDLDFGAILAATRVQQGRVSFKSVVMISVPNPLAPP